MAGNELPVPRDPTEDEALTLFKAIEEKFPSKTLGDDKWYVLAVSRHSSDVTEYLLTSSSLQQSLVEGNPALHHSFTKSS
jgi:hypothetical protein